MAGKCGGGDVNCGVDFRRRLERFELVFEPG